MNYKILVGNLILLIFVIIIIIFVVKGKKESFTNSENCDHHHHQQQSESGGIFTVDAEGNLIPGGGFTNPVGYNPNNYHMCKNIGWQNSDTPYKSETNQAWYDAEAHCKKDYRCQSFSTSGDPNKTSGSVNYYSTSNASEIAGGTWDINNKPNLYIKTETPCMKTIPVTIVNEDSTGNLQSSNATNMPYKYENDFITSTRTFLNDYNDFRIAKDSGEDMDNFFS